MRCFLVCLCFWNQEIFDTFIKFKHTNVWYFSIVFQSLYVKTFIFTCWTWLISAIINKLTVCNNFCVCDNTVSLLLQSNVWLIFFFFSLKTAAIPRGVQNKQAKKRSHHMKKKKKKHSYGLLNDVVGVWVGLSRVYRRADVKRGFERGERESDWQRDGSGKLLLFHN